MEQSLAFVVVFQRHHLGLITKDNDTLIPLSNSPEPEKVNWLPIVHDLPVESPAVIFNCNY